MVGSFENLVIRWKEIEGEGGEDGDEKPEKIG